MLTTSLEWTGNTGSAGRAHLIILKYKIPIDIVLPGSRTVPGFLAIGRSNSLDINNDTLTVNGGFSGTGVLKGSPGQAWSLQVPEQYFLITAATVLKTLTVNAGGNLSLGNSLI
jgi:hypothetical protein